MTESRHRESSYTGGWSQYPAGRGRSGQLRRQIRRQQRREHAARLLSYYVSEVVSALRVEGLAVRDVRIDPRNQARRAQRRASTPVPSRRPAQRPARRSWRAV